MALAKFEDTVLQSDSGRAYAGIVVEALSGGEPVQLYRDAGGSEPASQITTNANGLFTFWVGEGTYTIRYSLGGVTLGSQAGVEIYNLVKAADLADEEGAENVGVATGDTLQQFLDTLDQTSTQKANADAIGVSGADATMGTTPGTILSDNGTAKQWFQESEAAIEIAADNAASAKVVTDKFATTGTAQTLPKRTSRIDFPSSGPGAVFAFGTNGPNAGANYNGFQVGGGDAEWGSEGVIFGGDGHPAWLRMQPSRNYSPIENVIYPTSAQGFAQSQSGTNQLVRQTGSNFDSTWIGRKIYFGGAKYKVATVPDANNITVTTTGGGAVSFGSTTISVFHVFYVYGAGICDVNGTTVTHVSGDPFLYFAADPSHELKINGTVRAVASGAGAPFTLTLSASLGTLTGATYEYFTDIDDTMVQQRLQKFLGSTEENITQGVKPWCYFLRTQVAGSGLHYPVHFGSGNNNVQITLLPDGSTRFGWHGAIQNPALWDRAYVEVDGAAAGQSPTLRSRGVSANVGMSYDTQGTGSHLFTSNSYAKTNFQVFGSAGNDFLCVDAVTGAPFLAAIGASTDIDINLIPKGAGRVRLGGWTSNADAAVNGYITVKDSAGNARKVATIA